MRVAVRTEHGVFVVDLETEELLDLDAEVPASGDGAPRVELPRVVAAAASGSTVVAVVDRRPPLVVSHDAGRTWREAGGGLPAGFAVAIAEDDPDVVVYASRNRLHVSTNGGVFWRALSAELPEIEALALES